MTNDVIRIDYEIGPSPSVVSHGVGSNKSSKTGRVWKYFVGVGDCTRHEFCHVGPQFRVEPGCTRDSGNSSVATFLGSPAHSSPESL